MYHSWGSQNAWLRQITNLNYLYIGEEVAAKNKLKKIKRVSASSRDAFSLGADCGGSLSPLGSQLRYQCENAGVFYR